MRIQLKFKDSANLGSAFKEIVETLGGDPNAVQYDITRHHIHSFRMYRRTIKGSVRFFKGRYSFTAVVNDYTNGCVVTIDTGW